MYLIIKYLLLHFAWTYLSKRAMNQPLSYYRFYSISCSDHNLLHCSCLFILREELQITIGKLYGKRTVSTSYKQSRPVQVWRILQQSESRGI